MKLRNSLMAMCMALLGIGLSSCLDDNNDTPSTGTGTDIAVLTGLSDNSASFVVTTVENTTVNLYCNEAGLIDKEKFPVGSRVFITYNLLYGQNTNLPVKITLLSIKPVTVVSLDEATSPDDIALKYSAFSIGTTYIAGDYINIIASLNRNDKRTWQCYLDPATSSGEEANIYLELKDEGKTESIGTTEIVSINIGSLRDKYKQIIMHANTNKGPGYEYKYVVNN
ncbi:MAG: hypothetical protein NC338_00795 [Firmicutes bacterium]|nr:hypothetical protein [Bacillota bacterium]MCM1477435.1 hypothetical protein [Bacteroides sp.]